VVLRDRPETCPLCGADLEVPKTESGPELAELKADDYHDNVRKLRDELRKLRDDAEAV
jgi:hypothetical protein